MSEPLATLADVKASLRVKGDTDDALLSRMLAAASAWIETYLCRNILVRSYTDLRDGHGGVRLFIARAPLKSVESIHINDLPVTDFVVDAYGVVLKRGRTLTRGLANVLVTYTAGYDTVPADLVQACIDLVSIRYRELERLGQTSITNSTGPTIVFSISEIPPSIKVVLQQYRNVVPA